MVMAAAAAEGATAAVEEVMAEAGCTLLVALAARVATEVAAQEAAATADLVTAGAAMAVAVMAEAASAEVATAAAAAASAVEDWVVEMAREAAGWAVAVMAQQLINIAF